jgi:adenine-specific DNA-methyltransferase
MIAVKNDLKILQDRDGKRLKEYQVEVVNDELIVTDEEGELLNTTQATKKASAYKKRFSTKSKPLLKTAFLVWTSIPIR